MWIGFIVNGEPVSIEGKDVVFEKIGHTHYVIQDDFRESDR